KLIGKATFEQNEISGLVYSVKTGELLRSSWSNSIDVIDPQSGKPLEPLSAAPDVNMISALQFSAKGDRLIAVWSKRSSKQTNVTIWSWPQRGVLKNLTIPYDMASAIAISS